MWQGYGPGPMNMDPHFAAGQVPRGKRRVHPFTGVRWRVQTSVRAGTVHLQMPYAVCSGCGFSASGLQLYQAHPVRGNPCSSRSGQSPENMAVLRMPGSCRWQLMAEMLYCHCQRPVSCSWSRRSRSLQFSSVSPVSGRTRIRFSRNGRNSHGWSSSATHGSQPRP